MADLTTVPWPRVAARPSPPARGSSLHGRLVELVPLPLASRPSLVALYEALVVGGAGATWRTRGRTPSMDELLGLLTGRDGCGFAVVERHERRDGREGRTVGFVGLDEIDRAAGVGSVSAFFDQRDERAPLFAADALPRFCEHCFGSLGLRKLTIELPAPSASGIRAAADRLDCLVHEGTRTAHTRVGQHLEDVEVYAVWAAEFLTRRERLEQWRPRLVGTDPPVTFAAVAAAITSVSPHPFTEPIDPTHLLLDDLLLDSLALAELLEVLEARVGHELALDALGADACVQDLVALFDPGSLDPGSSEGGPREDEPP